MTSVDLGAEFNAARQAMTPPDRALLVGYGIAPGDILFLVGAATVRRDGNLYVPADDGLMAYVTPVLVDQPDTPEASNPAQAIRFGELVDIVAWHPSRPQSWALRLGATEWIGACQPQYLQPLPVRVHRGALGWLQHRACGLVPLSRDATDLYRLLSRFQAGIIADDEAHAAQLRRVLSMPWPAPPVAAAAPARRRAAA